MRSIRRKVAKALVEANPMAGRSLNGAPTTKTQRIENLLRRGPYGTYVEDGDPNDWGGGGAVATIYMEQQGDEGDCILPLDYWDGGFDHAFAASDILGDYFIEFVNAAIACVYRR